MPALRAGCERFGRDVGRLLAGAGQGASKRAAYVDSVHGAAKVAAYVNSMSGACHLPAYGHDRTPAERHTCTAADFLLE